MIVNSVINNKRKEWFVFIYVLFALFCFYPYEFYSVYLTFLPEKSYYTSLLLVMFSFLAVTIASKRTNTEKDLLPIAVVQIFGFTLVYAAHGNIINIVSTGLNILLAFLLVYYIEKTIGLSTFIKKYNIWILIMAIMGSITWALVTFVGFDPISIVYDRADEREIFNYGLTFSKSIQYGFRTIRYAGFFDEPGAMGYWGIFALLFNKVFIKSKHMEWLLIVFVSLTFSMGFYLQLLVYFLVFNVNTHNIGRTLVISFIVLVGIMALYSTKGTEYEGFYDVTIGRVETIMDVTEETGNVLEADNRAEMTELAKKEFHNNPIFGSDTKEYILDNIYEPLARYGIVGTVFILFPFFYLFFKALNKKDFDIVRVMIVLIVSFFHRPFHDFLLYYFILYCFVTMCKERWRSGLDRLKPV